MQVEVDLELQYIERNLRRLQEVARDQEDDDLVQDLWLAEQSIRALREGWEREHAIG